MYRRYIAIFAWPRRRDDRYTAVRPFTQRRRRVLLEKKIDSETVKRRKPWKSMVLMMLMKFKTRIRHHFAGDNIRSGVDRYSTVTRPLLDRYSTVTRPLRDRYTPFSCRIDICLGFEHGYVISHRDICLWLCDIRHRYLPTYRAICMPRASDHKETQPEVAGRKACRCQVCPSLRCSGRPALPW